MCHLIDCVFLIAACVALISACLKEETIEIVTFFVTGAEVAKKFKNLKDTYTRVKAQLEKANHKSGSGAKDIKKVKWRYFKQMISIMEISDRPA